QLIRYADVDGDKRLDAIVTDSANVIVEGGKASLKIAHNDGSGFGALETREVVLDDMSTPLQVDLIDFDGDGKADLYSSDGSDGFRVWFNDGKQFGPATRFALPAGCTCSAPSIRNYELVDLDGDGRLDLVEPADLKSYNDKKTTFLEVWGQ